jgi:hypothetical protein
MVCWLRTSVLSLATVMAAGFAALPSLASAAGWNCSASVLTGQPAGAPLAANGGGATCVAASAGGTTPPLPSPMQAGAASASTTLDGPAADPAAQRATATASLSTLNIGIPANVPINVPTTMLNVPLVGTFDITSALRSLVPVPAGPLVGVQASSAAAVGRCSNGSPQLTGSSQTTGVSALGLTLPTDQPVQQAVNVINATSIDPSSLSLSSLPVPVNGLPLAVVQPLLDALPNVAVPATAGQVDVTPGSQTVLGDTLTQTGPQLAVTVAGQPLADLTLGRASVSRGDVNCARAGDRGDGDESDAPTSGGAAVPLAQLACTSRKLALVDVLGRGGYARLQGVADQRYVGRRVEIVSRWNGKVVARPTVLANGTFQARGALPPKALRTSNRARYQARIGNERSLDLKLYRRMLIEQMSSSDGDVTIKGRILGPLGEPRRPITIKRRVSCTRDVTVKAVKPDASGRFAVTIQAPPTGQAAVYRLQTSVPRSARNRKLFPTFTLPRAVELRR